MTVRTEIIDEDDVWEGIPVANGVGIMFCPNDACKAPHIVLFDEDANPIIHVAVPDEFLLALEKILNRVN
jgi:hypothetical protein